MSNNLVDADEDFLLNDDKQNTTPLTSGEEILYDLLFNDKNELDPTKSNKKSDNNSYANNNSSSLLKSTNLEKEFHYLQEINSYHIDRLQAEPILLLESQQHIQEEIKNLAFSNYKTFIRTAQCSREIYSDFSIIESKLDQLITTLPEFGQLCENFTKNIQLINASRRTNNLTLQKHNQLLEILEISQLMDTCVRNEYYEEALDLASYVKRLKKKYSNSIPLIQKIVDDVNQSLNLMLKQLLQQLKTNIQFNQCLKIIGIIRRLELFTESELRIKFLQLRDSWLQSLLQSIPHTDPYHHISKTIEENRIHLFDIITQYRALFSDEDLITTSSTTSPNNIFLNPNKDSNESKLFYCWLQQKIKNFLNVLSKDLKLGVGNRLDSVLSQAMYFGLAFSRVGLDFRVLMVPIFEDAIQEQFKSNLKKANSKFEESLLKLNWSDLNTDNIKSSNKLNAEIQASLASSNLSIVNPPIQLLEFQPLAIYLNVILQSFNELRLCAPVSLFSKLSNQLKLSIKSLSEFLSTYYKKEKQTFDKNENDLFVNYFLFELVYTLVPYLERCLFILFPIDQLQKLYGIGQSDLEKLKSSFNLDVNDLFESIKELIPTPPEKPDQTISTVQSPQFFIQPPEQEVGTNDILINQDSNIIAEEDQQQEETPKEQSQEIVQESIQENEQNKDLTNSNDLVVDDITKNETEHKVDEDLKTNKEN